MFLQLLALAALQCNTSDCILVIFISKLLNIVYVPFMFNVLLNAKTILKRIIFYKYGFKF